MGAPPDGASDPVDLSKPAAGDGAVDESFDPYRFGAPDVPPPPEYAPPGYRPPPGYQYPPGAAAPGPHGPYPPYPYGTTASGYGPPPTGYGPAPYGAPYGPPPQVGSGNGKAVAALVLGIASIVLFWTTIFDAVFVVLALIFGALGLGDAGRRGGRGRGQAIAGMVCAAIGGVLAVVFLVVVVHLANQCGGLGNQNDSGFQQCLRDKI